MHQKRYVDQTGVLYQPKRYRRTLLLCLDDALRFFFKICDANTKILNCNARFPSSTHDAAIWNLSPVKRHLKEKYSNNELIGSWLIG